VATSSEVADLDRKRASRYASTGNFKKAAASYQRVLSEQPDNVGVLASMEWMKAELGRETFDEALAQIRHLVTANPDDDRVPGVLVSILTRMGRLDESHEERRIYFDRFPESPVALQVMANGLQVNPETKDSPEAQAKAWEYYQRALLAGPLLSPCFKSAALYTAKRVDPEHANSALKGSSPAEYWALKTRSLGPTALMLILGVGVAASALTLSKALAASICLQVLTLSWGAWCVYANNLMCCKKCRDAWITMLAYLTLLAGVYDHPRTWYIAAAVAAVAVIWAVSTGHVGLIRPSAKDSEKIGAAN